MKLIALLNIVEPTITGIKLININIFFFPVGQICNIKRPKLFTKLWVKV